MPRKKISVDLPKSQTEENNHKGKLLFASPHPFIDPHICQGKIAIPQAWANSVIKFNPKSSTISEAASLNFFLSQESFELNNPQHSFWGSINSKSYFKNIELNNVTEIYYRFEALPGAKKPVLTWKTLFGIIGIHPENGIFSFDHEDDSLYNLIILYLFYKNNILILI